MSTVEQILPFDMRIIDISFFGSKTVEKNSVARRDHNLRDILYSQLKLTAFYIDVYYEQFVCYIITTYFRYLCFSL